MWKNKMLVKSLKLSDSSITALCTNDNLVICGFANFSIILYDVHLKIVTEIKGSHIPLAVDYYHNNLIIGKDDGTIQDYMIIDNAASGGRIIASSHTNDVHALAVSGNTIITAGDDNQILLWDYRKREQCLKAIINTEGGPSQKYGETTLCDFPDNQCSRAISLSKNLNVAVALNSGDIQIRKSISNIGLILYTIKAS